MLGSPDTAPAPQLTDEGRLALVVATQTYADPALRQLRAPARDVEELTEVLADPEVGGFSVTSVIDKAGHEIRLAIEEFLDDRRTGDLLLVYLSCHGLVDLRRRLFFAASDTLKHRLAATGIEAQWLLDQLDDCRARRQIVILDCCFSGAFANTAKGDADLGLADRFSTAGRGRVVLTASRGSEYSFEGEPVPGSTMPGSLFTGALVEGIRSGAADLDKDGLISVDDAYGYAFDRLRAAEAHQTPQRWLYGAEGEIFLARNPAGMTITPAALPDGIRSGLDSPHVQIRLGAVGALADWLAESDPAKVLAARQALQDTAENDVPKVAEAAQALLAGEPPTSESAAQQARRFSPSPGGEATTRDEDSSGKKISFFGKKGTRRRQLIFAAPLAILLAISLIYAIIQLVGDQRRTPQGNAVASPPANEFQEQGPWRLVVRNDGSPNGCTVNLINADSKDTLSTPYPVYDTASFVIPASGTFRWSAETGCTVVSRPGPGSLTLPAVVDGVGTYDAFEPPAIISVSVKDFYGNARCRLQLMDAAGSQLKGTVIDIGELNKQKRTVKLDPEGRPLVYLFSDACAVQVSAG